ncbi:nitrate/nitrite transporter [Chloroflexota bacterium]
MVEESIDRYPRYRWIVLGMAWLTQVAGTWSWYLVPSLAYVLFPELGLSQTQFTLLYTGPLIATIFLSALGGGFGDRYGIRLAVAVGSFLYGIAGLARAFATSFEVMFVLMLLIGMSISLISPNLPKLVGTWFPPRQVGLASGIYVSAQAIGFSLGLMTGPLFSGWREAFTYVGIGALVVAVLWALIGRSTPQGVEIEKKPIISGIIRGAKSRNVRLLGLVIFCIMGAFLSISGNLPKALEGVHQVGAGAAGAISSMLTWGAVIGSIALPTISDRVGLRKPFLYGGAVIAAICFYTAWQVAPGGATGVIVFIGGIFLGGLVPLALVLPLEFPEIGHEYVGGTAGLVSSLGHMGGVLFSLLVVSPLVAEGTIEAYSTGFMGAALLLACIALPAAFLMETGSRRC